MALSGAILDFDGTIVDTLDAWRSLEGSLAADADIVVTPEDRRKLTTFTLDETADWFHTQHGLGESAAAVRASIDDYMVDFLSRSVRVLPGVEAFLEACKQAGVELSVASSSPQLYLQTALKGTGLLPYFSHVISVEDIGHSKREPHIYHHARELLGTPKAETWGFDDSLYALQTLDQAGYPTVGVFDAHEGIPFEQWHDHATLAIKSFEDLSLDQFE